MKVNQSGGSFLCDHTQLVSRTDLQDQLIPGWLWAVDHFSKAGICILSYNHTQPTKKATSLTIFFYYALKLAFSDFGQLKQYYASFHYGWTTLLQLATVYYGGVCSSISLSVHCPAQPQLQYFTSLLREQWNDGSVVLVFGYFFNSLMEQWKDGLAFLNFFKKVKFIGVLLFFPFNVTQE